MIKHRETRIEHLAGALSRWPSYWRVALCFLSVGGLCLALGFATVAQLSSPVVEAGFGTVVRFSIRPGTRYRGDSLIIVVRMSDGRIRDLSANGTDVHHCRVGSPIRLRRRGSEILIHPDGCPRPS